MATKIRLQRHGRSKRPYYFIVVADSRARRDGKFVDRIGSYNPLTTPATIDIDFDKAFKWVMTGAEPTDTVRKILSYKGVMYKKHLARGLRKGALTEEQVEEKMNAWLEYKTNKIADRVSKLSSAKDIAKAEKLAAETKKKEEYAKKLEAELNPVVEEEAVVEETNADVADAVESTETAQTEETATEAPTEE